MFSRYKPTWMIEAIYQMTPEQLKIFGIKAILTDLDNTLIAWNNPDGTHELREWLDKMSQADIPVVVISNNNHERIERAVKPFGLPFIARALKPLPRGINQALKKLDLAPEEVIMVGDQLMTDICAANLANVRNVLVKPVVSTDSWKTQFNRFLERHIMSYLLKKHPSMQWKGELE